MFVALLESLSLLTAFVLVDDVDEELPTFGYGVGVDDDPDGVLQTSGVESVLPPPIMLEGTVPPPLVFCISFLAIFFASSLMTTPPVLCGIRPALQRFSKHCRPTGQ